MCLHKILDRVLSFGYRLVTVVRNFTSLRALNRPACSDLCNRRRYARRYCQL